MYNYIIIKQNLIHLPSSLLPTLIPVDSELPITNEFVVAALVASDILITGGFCIEMLMGLGVFWKVSPGELPIAVQNLGGLPAGNAADGSLVIESDLTALKLLNLQHTGEV